MRFGDNYILLEESNMRLKHCLYLIILACFFINSTFAEIKSETKSEAKHTKSHHKVKHTTKHKSHAKHKQIKTANSKRDYMHGTASYYGYGDGFDGRQMANGETFDADNQFVAAHPTLPLGTKLKVINERNGRIAYVEIKDRMPHGRRIIDLSYGAAGALGMQHRGLSRVTLVRIDNAEFFKHKHDLEARNDSDNTQG